MPLKRAEFLPMSRHSSLTETHTLAAALIRKQLIEPSDSEEDSSKGINQMEECL